MTWKSTRLILTLTLLVCGAPASYAQMGEKIDKQSSASSPMQELLKMQSPMRTSVLDGPVDAAAYIVGPGDVFSVSI